MIPNPDILKKAINISAQKEKLDKLKDKVENRNNINDIKPDKITAGGLANIITPLLSTILRVNTSINSSIDGVIQRTRTQLSTKGRVEVNNGLIAFVPIKNESYAAFKQRFIRDVERIKVKIKILDAKIKALNILYKTLNLTILLIEKKAIVDQIKTTIQSKAAQAESSFPSQSKPTTGNVIGTKIPDHELRLSKLEGKPVLPTFKKSDAVLMILKAVKDALKGYIPLAKQGLVEINNRANSLQLLIGSSPDEETKKLTDQITPSVATELTETYNNYILKINQLADGSYQVVATDVFSGMKITQTAPSKFFKPDQLFEEIKQILG